MDFNCGSNFWANAQAQVVVAWEYEEWSITQDSLNYKYNAGTNQLQYITDNVLSTVSTTDIDNQSPNNYIYDKSGNMVADNSQSMSVSWSPYGKILQTNKAGGASLAFGYNAMQQRVVKRVVLVGDTTRTYYIRDAQGNTMGVYTRHNDSVSWREQYIFGSSRLGLYRADTLVNKGLQVISKLYEGKRNYELTNHLGNVMAVINDRKTDSLSATNVKLGYNAVVISAVDYFPFGMAIDSRSYTSSLYRFGFNGKENDKETGEQDYGMRIYDPRIAKFLSLDPLSKKYPFYSPYQFAGDMPIKFIDLDGAEPTGAGTDPHSLIIVQDAYQIGVGGNSKWVFNASSPSSGFKVGIPYYKGAVGTFSSGQIWRMEQLTKIDREVHDFHIPYVTPNQNKYGPYDCLELARENAKILFGKDLPSLRPGKQATMNNFLEDMAANGFAGESRIVNFADAQSKIINNGEREIGIHNPPKSNAFFGASVEETMMDLAKDKRGIHVFGIALADGFHSLTVSLDNSTDNIKFTGYDQTGYFRTYERGTLDQDILNYINKQAHRGQGGSFSGIPTANGGKGNYQTEIKEYINNDKQ